MKDFANQPIEPSAVDADNKRKKAKKGKKKKKTQEQVMYESAIKDTMFDENGKPRSAINDEITLHQKAFNRDSFHRLIKRTFDDYYP